VKHNFPKHRYKHGKQKKAIDLGTFSRMLKKVDKLKLPPRMRERYDPLTIKSFLAILYWTGLRKTEVIGAKSHRYILPSCPQHKEPIPKYTEQISGIMKEDIDLVGDNLRVYAVCRKHGKRESALEIWIGFPYVNLIIEQWRLTPEGERVWAFSEWDAWFIMKQIDQKKYLHFFRFNKITDLCMNPEMSIGEICSWSGLTAQTIEAYMERSGRLISQTNQKMRKRYEETTPTF